MKIPSKIRHINKKYINRVMLKIAGKSHSPIAVIRHRGRKSGKTYSTPIIAAKDQAHYVFALTYGTDVDWYRNVLAQGSAELLWHGQWYELAQPEPLDGKIARKSFASPLAVILTLLGIENYFQMEIIEKK